MSGGSPSATSGAEAPRLLHEFLATPVRRWPEHAAVEVPEGEGRPRRSLTYRELAQRSDALAARIAPRAGPEDIVAILLSRETPELFVAQLAVSKAGAAFACIDPTLPDDYARFLVEDTDAALLITDAAGAARAAALGVEGARVVEVGEAGPVLPPAPALPERAAPGNLAYVIYTSGTTGRPKGVLVEHGSIANLVASDLREFGLGPGDRVAQNSSPSYDSSLEEIWLALAAGATLVVLDDRTVRSGPDLPAWLEREHITVFCPPPTLLRATGCREPERDLPGVRLVYVGGEALTDDVASLWSRGRRLENGYGPTECAVTAVRGRVEPGASVTIGRPIEGNRAWILDEELREVVDGAIGELCIGGVGLARGYRNLAQLTAERFPTHPELGRLYRTGDLVHRDARGEFVYIGRRDSQVKVRGHRIELEAIEARLAEQPGVREAACRVQGEGTRRVVVAFVVPSDPAVLPDFERLRAALAAVLPAPMVPARIGALDALPTSVGGKLDRKRLPLLELAARSGGPVAPLDALEARVAESFRAVLGPTAAFAADDDFFVDLGGDSLAAAELVSRLRDDPETAAITVRDLYDARSVRALAERCRNAVPRPSGAAVARASRRVGGKPVFATLAQSAWILAELVVLAALAQLAATSALPWLVERLGLAGTLLAAPFLALAVILAWAPLALAYAFATKKLLIGAYRPLRAPAWGGFHVRHWIVMRAARRIPWRLFAGTELTSMALRVLGARVGRRVHIHRGVEVAGGGWDLLELGDDATLSQDASLRLAELVDGELAIGAIRIGARATLGIRAGAGRDTEVGRDALLESLSWLDEGARIPDGERWDGVPARPAGRAPGPPDGAAASLSVTAHASLVMVMRTVLRVFRELPLLALALLTAHAVGAEGATIAGWLRAPSFEPRMIWIVFGVLVARVPLSLVVEALVVRALSPSRPGVIARCSFAYARVWLVAERVDGASTWLSGTLLWPVWLRLAGMRVGRNCEVSTLLDLVPSLVEIGDETFLADGIYLGGPRVQAGRVALERTVLRRDTFVGNHAIVPAGAHLPVDVLIGVCTVADPSVVRGSGVWFGHPPFKLVRKPQAEFDRSLTHEPGMVRRATRWFWETLRFALPVPIAALGLTWFAFSDVLAAGVSGVRAVFAAALATLACAVLAWLAVVALKWFLLGRVRPGRHPLWSCWCSRWDFLFVAWDLIARNVLTEIEGTLLLNGCLRAFGMRIGRGVLLGPGFAQVVDPDMLDFEDGATVNGSFQAHTFEDRVLKIGPVVIRRGATVGAQAVLFYGADVGAAARVAPHGVVLKGDRLRSGGDFAGVPTQPA